MDWLLIFLVLAIGFGPVFWLWPSKKERRLTLLREAARKEGLTVQVGSLRKLDPSALERVSASGVSRQPIIECMTYSLHAASGLKMRRQRLRRTISDLEEASGEVIWIDDPEIESSKEHFDLLSVLNNILPRLPNDILAIELDMNIISLYWLEGPAATSDTVAQLAQLLREIDSRLII
ncbi:MAG: hypothetical protein CMD74_03925 [Gammaproteobacteria bacterium]|nr:hypothetical protein [Gammaproteobacteria bacterium]